MTTTDDLSDLRKKPFSDAVEKFEKLLVQSGRAFLIGAGCSKCAGLPLTAELTTIVIQNSGLDPTSKEILTGIENQFDGAKNSHIEDYLSELVDLLAIAERRAERGALEARVPIDGKLYSAENLRLATEKIKQSISNAIDTQVKTRIHQEFVRAVHQPIRVGKAAPGSIVDYLVLNYDTVVEDALAIERIPFADGIDGGETGWWNPETFDRDALAARVLKLHGSVDWCEFVGESLPRRIAPNLQIQDMRGGSILIWPASTKYRETQLDPFAQLADRARRVMRPVRGSQRVLVICGYAFGDAHINIEIDGALHESRGDLTVIVFTSDDEPVGRLRKWNQTPEIREQVLIFAKRGFFHGDTADRADYDLPWWKFENVVRLLGGER
ncbi:MAG: SIR2 family protein [Gammaproteobacteria bacterium]|nr:SIR2 family protein [Gammaproteobacteria bacterium]MDE0248117.1 SIR2 family protein [Gammaproteobacteria bacterium]